MSAFTIRQLMELKEILQEIGEKRPDFNNPPPTLWFSAAAFAVMDRRIGEAIESKNRINDRAMEMMEQYGETGLFGW